MPVVPLTLPYIQSSEILHLDLLRHSGGMFSRAEFIKKFGIIIASPLFEVPFLPISNLNKCDETFINSTPNYFLFKLY